MNKEHMKTFLEPKFDLIQIIEEEKEHNTKDNLLLFEKLSHSDISSYGNFLFHTYTETKYESRRNPNAIKINYETFLEERKRLFKSKKVKFPKIRRRLYVTSIMLFGTMIMKKKAFALYIKNEGKYFSKLHDKYDKELNYVKGETFDKIDMKKIHEILKEKYN